MAEKKTRTTHTTARTYTVHPLIRKISFVAVLLMGLGIAIGVVLGWFDAAARAGAWIKNIAIALGLIALCMYSYYEARNHGRNWFIVWIVAVMLIVVFYILGIALPNPFK